MPPAILSSVKQLEAMVMHSVDPTPQAKPFNPLNRSSIQYSVDTVRPKTEISMTIRMTRSMTTLFSLSTIWPEIGRISIAHIAKIPASRPTAWAPAPISWANFGSVIVNIELEL